MKEPQWYQHKGADFLEDRYAGLLADEPRVGKTFPAIMVCDRVRARIVCVVCPAHLRENWRREIEDCRRGDWIAIIVSYNRLPDLLKRLVKFDIWLDVVIVDESHYAKERSAIRTRALYGITCNRIGGLVDRAERVYCLTGTPQPNSPIELWPMLRSLAPELIADPKRGGRPYTYSGWKSAFCRIKRTPFGEKIVGTKNAKRLRQILSDFMLRRTRKEVFGRDLLPATTLYVRAEGVELAQLRALASSEQGRLVAEILRNGGGLRELNREKEHVAALRRLIGLAKVPSVCKVMADEMDDEPDKKFVLACIHHDVIDAAMRALRPYGPLQFDGRRSADKRQGYRDVFQDPDSKYRVAVVQIEAGKVGYDLSAADDTMFLEQSWVGDDNEQLRSRVFNMNKDRPCFTRFAVLSGSKDEEIVREAQRKINDSEMVFG